MSAIIDKAKCDQGLTRVEKAADADVALVYHLAVNSTFALSGYNDPTFAATGGVAIPGTNMWSSGFGIPQAIQQVRKGVLILELYDLKRHGLLWVATAKANADDMQAKRVAQVDQALVKMVEKYPADQAGKKK